MALPTDDLLTTAEVASLARVTPATANAWAREKTVRAVKVNGRWRFSRADVLRVLGLEQEAAS